MLDLAGNKVYNNNVRKERKIMKTNIKAKPLNEKQSAFVNALKETEGLTLAEASAKAGVEIKSGSINTLVKKGLVTIVGDREIVVKAKRKIKVFAIATAPTADAKLNDKQKAFLAALADTEGLTLAEASEKTGIEIKSGSINTLTKKGLVAIVGEREILVDTKRKVKVFALAASTEETAA